MAEAWGRAFLPMVRCMTCTACADFAANRLSGSYRKGCLECDARQLAQSPLFWESSKAGNITQAYRSALDKIFGKDWLIGHANVKRYAGLCRGGV